MGTNGRWIQVEVKDQDGYERLVHGIESYWRSAGAKLAGRDWQPLVAYGLAHSHILGLALRSAHSGWCTICDSERYTADYALASYLASALGFRVRFVGTWDVSQVSVDRYLGRKGRRCPVEPADAYEDLGPAHPDRSEWSFLCFQGVDPARYGPEPTPEDDPKPPALEPRGAAKESYLVTPTNVPFVQTDTMEAYGDLVAALNDLAGRKAGFELRALSGRCQPLDGERVRVFGASHIDSFSPAELFEGWLQALLSSSKTDVADAENVVRTAKRFATVRRQHPGWCLTLDEGALDEARIARSGSTSDEAPAALLARVDAGDVDACIPLERAAFRAFDFGTWRYARATREGKTVIAKLYRARL